MKEVCSYGVESTTKNWLENEYRVFIWFVLVLSETVCTHPKNFVIYKFI